MHSVWTTQRYPTQIGLGHCAATLALLQANTSTQGPMPESFRRAHHGEHQDATAIPDTKSHEDLDGDMTFMWVDPLAWHLAKTAH